MKADTIGGGTISSPAIGPAPSYGLGGPNAVLVKNWDFGTGGTIKNNADLSAHFFFHDQFNTISNKYGSKIVSPDAANALPGQPIEGVNCPTIREYTGNSLKTYLHALNGTTTVHPVTNKAGSGSFMAKWNLPAGGAILGMDMVWETRVRMVTPKYFWFALWTAGNAWDQGAEHDLVESFGYDNGSGNTNYDGRYWHSNSVRGSDVYSYHDNWGASMAEAGVTEFDASEWHTWTLVYRADNSYAFYMDGILVQKGVTPYFWTLGTREKGAPINMSFLFDGAWGHTEIDSVKKDLDASELAGKYYEFDYSRVYLVQLTEAPAVPTGLSVDAGHEEVLLNWTLTDRATSYRVYRGLQPDGSDAVLVASGLKNVTYIDKNLVNDTTYYYRVTGVNVIGESAQSAPISAVPILMYTIDDADPARANYVGAWTASTSTAGYFGTGYRHDANTGAVGGKRAILTPTFLGSGSYKIYTRVPAGANRASNAPFDINHASGTTTIPVNEQINSNQWVLLGEFPFSAGSSGNVTVRNDGANGFVMVDALRFVPTSITAPSAAPTAPAGLTATSAGNQVTLKWNLNTDPAAEAAEYFIYRSSTHNDSNPVLIDSVSNVLTFTDSTVQNGGLYYYTVVATNSAGVSPRSLEVGARIAGEVGDIVDDVDPNITFTGTWTESSFEPGSYGNLYHVAAVGDGKHATYQPDLPAAGRYEIFMRWTAGTSRAANAPVDVYGSNGNLITTVTVNQTVNNNTWVSIGKYDFAAGTGSSIRLRNDGTTATVISDAAKWVLQTAPGTITLGNLTQIYDGSPKIPSYTTSPAGMNAWITYNGSTTEPTAPGRYTVVATLFDPNYTGSTTATMLIAQTPTAAPSAPLGLSATAGNKQVTLSWQANTNPAAEAFEYQIYRSTTHNDPNPTQIGTTTTELSYTDTGLQGGTVYYYTIAAVNALGVSPRSWEVGAAPTGDVTTVIVDDPAAIYTGAWTYSVSQTGYYGTGYRHDANTGTVGGKKAKFTPTIPQSGTYAVYTRAPSGTNRASNIPFDINHSGGLTTVPVDEQINNNAWVLLGKYIFDAGTTGNVTVRNDSANGFVMVDAIRWVSSSLDATVSLDSLSHTYDGTAKEATYTTSPAGLNVWVSYNGSTTPPTAAGSYEVVATINDANYSGSVTGTMVIAQAPQALSVPNPGVQQLSSSFALPATSSVGLPISYTVISGPATVTGNQVTITGAGTVVIRASQPGNGSYQSASDVDITFTVDQGAATVSIANLAQGYDGTPKSVSTTTNPAGVNVNVTYNGSATAPIYPGSHEVVATIADPNYAGSPASGTLVISTTALVRHAPTLNNDIDGSLQMILPENTALNGTAMISKDLLVPGTPNVVLNGTPTYGGTVDGSGSASPSNYTITLNQGSVLPHVVRRIDAVTMPVVSAPPAPAGNRDVVINIQTQSSGDASTLRDLTLNSNAGSHAIPAGTYGAFTVNGNSELVLGVPGSTEPAVYNFQRLTVNTASGAVGLKIVGPVIVTLAKGTSLQSTAGSPAHPEWLILRLATSGLTLNSGAAFHGSVVAPNGTVTLNNATLRGTVVSDRLVLNGTGLLVDPGL